MAPEDEDNKNKKDGWFKTPEWFNNMSKTSKTISVLLLSTIAILGIASQVLSFGFDQVQKWQQIEKNSIDITAAKKEQKAVDKKQDIEIKNIKCINDKKEQKQNLKDAEKAKLEIDLDYVSKGKEIPSILKDTYLGLPSTINTLKDDIKKLNCSE